MRLTRSIYGVVGVLVCLGVGSSVALGAGSSGAAGGPIHIFVQPGHGQGNGKIVITGAIGDYGVTRQVRGGGGKRLATAKLRKGTVTFDLTAINDKLNSTTPTFDKATCSASISASAPVPVVRGTGRYAGIHGSVRLTESFGFVGSRHKSGPKKGQCNLSHSAPAAQLGEVYGSGTIGF